ncbi:MAG: hypothetical protein H6707_07905 [Deltaproteobacteria bacterium]|nr:hypothetical protein [Deltaproteobacteria bacterium]
MARGCIAINGPLFALLATLIASCGAPREQESASTLACDGKCESLFAGSLVSGVAKRPSAGFVVKRTSATEGTVTVSIPIHWTGNADAELPLHDWASDRGLEFVKTSEWVDIAAFQTPLGWMGKPHQIATRDVLWTVNYLITQKEHQSYRAVVDAWKNPRQPANMALIFTKRSAHYAAANNEFQLGLNTLRNNVNFHHETSHALGLGHNVFGGADERTVSAGVAASSRQVLPRDVRLTAGYAIQAACGLSGELRCAVDSPRTVHLFPGVSETDRNLMAIDGGYGYESAIAYQVPHELGNDQPNPVASEVPIAIEEQLRGAIAKQIDGYKDAPWEVKAPVYTAAAKLVYEHYDLSFVSPAIQAKLIKVIRQWKPVLETELAGSAPEISLSAAWLDNAARNTDLLGNFVSVLVHEYIHVWQHFNGYAGDDHKAEREFLANAYNVLGAKSAVAGQISQASGVDFASLPPALGPQRTISAAAALKDYWPKMPADRQALLQGEYEAVLEAYTVLTKSYTDSGTVQPR